MKWRKNILKICAFLIICTIAGLITANIIAKPNKLTDEEIRYYTHTAENVWYEGLDSIEADDSIRIGFKLKEREVTIISTNEIKQSVSVKFYETEELITINEPEVSFWGCVVFYGLLFGFCIFEIIDFLVFIVKKSKRTSR